MLGLYIFWFFVLVGGQISYALQNVQLPQQPGRLAQSERRHPRGPVAADAAGHLPPVQGVRGPPARSCSSAELIKVPTQVINECLNRLGDLGFVAAIPPARGQASLDYRYQPARPPDRITLAEFKQRLRDLRRELRAREAWEAADPVLRLYHDRLARHLQEALGRQTLDELLAEFPAEVAAVAGAAR